MAGLSAYQPDRNSNSTVSFGITFWNLLFFIFLILKLTGFIDWSWWYVTAPLWGPIVLFLVIGVIFVIGFLAYGIYKDYQLKRKVIELIKKTKKTIKLG